MDGHIRGPFPPVQQREESRRVGTVQDPPERFQPFRVPWEGVRQQPHHRDPAWIYHEHAGTGYAATPQ